MTCHQIVQQPRRPIHGVAYRFRATRFTVRSTWTVIDGTIASIDPPEWSWSTTSFSSDSHVGTPSVLSETIHGPTATIVMSSTWATLGGKWGNSGFNSCIELTLHADGTAGSHVWADNFTSLSFRYRAKTCGY